MCKCAVGLYVYLCACMSMYISFALYNSDIYACRWESYNYR